MRYLSIIMNKRVRRRRGFTIYWLTNRHWLKLFIKQVIKLWNENYQSSLSYDQFVPWNSLLMLRLLKVSLMSFRFSFVLTLHILFEFRLSFKAYFLLISSLDGEGYLNFIVYERILYELLVNVWKEKVMHFNQWIVNDYPQF